MAARAFYEGESFLFMYRYITLCESCSRFDLPPLINYIFKILSTKALLGEYVADATAADAPRDAALDGDREL